MSLAETWERVHTVHDYYNGPVTGVADYEGQPHAYSRIFCDEADEWTEEYWLSPISHEQLKLVLADWRRWETAFHAKALGPLDTHPVLAADRDEYERVRHLVEDARTVNRPNTMRRKGQFRGFLSASDDLRVRWSSPN